MKKLLKYSFFMLWLTSAIILRSETRAEFIEDVSSEIAKAQQNGALDYVLDNVIVSVLRDYVNSRVFYDDEMRIHWAHVDNDNPLSNDELDYRIGLLEANRRTVRQQLGRDPKSLDQFLQSSGFDINNDVTPELRAVWKNYAAQIAPGTPDA